MLTLIAAHGAYADEDPSGALSIASYMGGTLLGVGLVTHAREGIRRFGPVIGAAIGGALGLGTIVGLCETVGQSVDDPGCAPGPGVVGGLVFALAAPIGAAGGHSWFH